jgi:hypothetical protein
MLASPPPLAGVETSFVQQVDSIKNIIAGNAFKAKRVLLYVPPRQIIQIDAVTFRPTGRYTA